MRKENYRAEVRPEEVTSGYVFHNHMVSQSNHKIERC